MTPDKSNAHGLEMGEMNQRYAALWLEHLQVRERGDNGGLMPPMGSLGGLKCDFCRTASECDGFFCSAHISQVL